jgi:hypothetical protein
MPDALICDAVRTPFGRYGGALSSIRADDLAAIPIRALLTRNPRLDPAAIGDVVYGCANQAGEDNRDVARMALLLAGSALPFALTCLIMLSSGVFSRFWFWTFSYAGQYGNIVKFSQGLEIFGEAISGVVEPAALIWIIAAIGAVAVLWGP